VVLLTRVSGLFIPQVSDEFWVFGGSDISGYPLAEIELKSLILAQIERWRHALHMQVERGQQCLSGERVSNASERAQ